MTSEIRPGRACLVVPCFNEASRLDMAAFTCFAEAHEEVEFVLVDDGSTDNTPALLHALSQHASGRFADLSLARNAGKAEAVRQGLLQALRARTEYVGFWDADLATPLEALPDFCRVLESRPTIDLAIGSRVRLLGREVERRTVRHLVGRVFATLISLLLRLPVYDSQCGAKVFRASEELKLILARPFLTRWLFDVEIFARLQRARSARGGRPVVQSAYELPLQVWRDQPGSKLRLRDGGRVLLELGRVFFWLHRPAPWLNVGAGVPGHTRTAETGAAASAGTAIPGSET